jgi:hypothetical protein
LAIPNVNKIMKSFRGRKAGQKWHQLGGKLTALTCHLTKKVNKTE